MQGRRGFTTGLAAVAAAIGFAGMARAQYYPQPGYPPGPPRYPDDEDRRRFEERRREEDRRREYGGGGRPGYQDRVYAMEQERNRRVLYLQQQLQRGQIGRREFDDRVAGIDRELHDRLEGR